MLLLTVMTNKSLNRLFPFVSRRCIFISLSEKKKCSVFFQNLQQRGTLAGENFENLITSMQYTQHDHNVRI